MLWKAGLLAMLKNDVEIADYLYNYIHVVVLAV
jgi:hypothetical protein